jgi:benzoate-CoA ligase family protein
MKAEAKMAPSQGLTGNVVDYLLENQTGPGHAQRPYLIAPDRTWSYGEFAARIARIANALRSLGINPGERVLFSVVDGIDFPSIFLGAMKIGAIAIPINTYLKADDYHYFIADSEAVAVIVDHTIAPVIASMRDQLPCVRYLLSAGERVAGIDFLDDALRGQQNNAETYPVKPDDMAFWLYSSGSTGSPKGVVHTGAHIYWACELFGHGALVMHEEDVVLSPPKMYFAFGLGNQVYFPIRAGAQNIVNPGPITPDVVWQQWLEHEPTVVMGVPTLFAAMLRLAEEKIGQDRVRRACRRLRLCVSGGEILPAALLERWKEFAGVEILDGVGTTEMTHMFILNRPAQSVPGSCGRLVNGFRAEIVDDDDKPVRRGEIGNLRVFGPSAARQYWNKPEKTAQVMGRGGVLTGDKLYQDEDGNFFLVGRSDDMLRVGGIWVSPAEVEGVIAQHRAVMECAVVGHPDADNMIKPKAYVVLRQENDADHAPLADELRAHVRERIAHIKCPRWFEFVDELPKTSTGKIQRFRLRSENAAR